MDSDDSGGSARIRVADGIVFPSMPARTPARTKPRQRSAPAGSGRSQGTREKILGVAAAMISRHGISGLRVEEVAAEAGVSTALLYYHFHSRAGLVEAAFEMASEKAPTTALRVASDGRSGYEALEDALLAELDPKPSVRAYAIVWGEVTARAVFDDELRPRVRALTHAWGQTVAGAIVRGIEDGSISADVVPEDAADVLIGLVDGFSARWLSGSLELGRAQDLLRIAVRQLRA